MRVAMIQIWDENFDFLIPVFRYPALFSALPSSNHPIATVDAMGKRFDQNWHPKLPANLWFPERLQD